jgi:hypothetical protein
MEDLLKKILKIESLVRIKKIELQKIQMALAQTRQKKALLINEMKSKQLSYLEGVEHLNSVRTSSFRNNLKTLEEAVDHSKSLWFNSFKAVQEADFVEKSQIQQAITAETNLKAIEQIQTNYQSSYSAQVQIFEQKQLDEFSIRKTDKHR